MDRRVQAADAAARQNGIWRGETPASLHGKDKRFWGYDDILAADELLRTAMAVLRRAAVTPVANDMFRGPTDRQAFAIDRALVLLGRARRELANMESEDE